MALLFRDDFTGTTGNPSVGGRIPDGVGGAWSLNSGTCEINSTTNTLRPRTSAVEALIPNQSDPDASIKLAFAGVGTGDWDGRVVLRYVNASNYIGIHINQAQAGQCILMKRVANVETTLHAFAYTAGQEIEVIPSGSDLELIVNSVSLGTFTAAEFTTETNIGIASVGSVSSSWLSYLEVNGTSSGAPPTGTTTVDSVTTTETTADINYSYDAADETGFNYRIDGGATVDAGISNPIQVTGLAASTAYTVEVQAYNASGAGSWSASFPFSTDAATTTSLTTEPLKNNTGQLLSNESGVIADVYNVADGILALRKTGLISDGLGVVTISDASLSPATEYRVVIQLSGGEEGIARITSV